jgi:hypothetical protein
LHILLAFVFVRATLLGLERDRARTGAPVSNSRETPRRLITGHFLTSISTAVCNRTAICLLHGFRVWGVPLVRVHQGQARGPSRAAPEELSVGAPSALSIPQSFKYVIYTRWSTHPRQDHLGFGRLEAELPQAVVSPLSLAGRCAQDERLKALLDGLEGDGLRVRVAAHARAAAEAHVGSLGVRLPRAGGRPPMRLNREPRMLELHWTNF